MQDNQEFNVRFVRLVEIYPCLYDNTREDYQWSHAQDRAWKNIATEIGGGVTIPECKSRWKNLRGNYTKHLKNCSLSGSLKKRPYYLAKYMTFVSSFTKSRQHKGNDVSTNKNAAIIFDDEPSVFMPDTKDAIEYEKDREEETIQMNDETVLRYKESETAHDDLTASRQSGTSHETQKLLSYKLPATSNNNDDADVHFLLSLLPDFRRMSDIQKRQFKIGILNLGATLMSNTFQPTMRGAHIRLTDRFYALLAERSPNSQR